MPHRSDLFLRWSRETKHNRYFRPGERVGVAISGGPDSVLLLEFMNQFARETALSISVVHFNHRLRGEESEADEQFVRERAKTLGLEFLGAEAPASKAAGGKRRNQEATARELRYRFFFSLIRQGRLEKVATAHNVNDQAETVLLRLLRGTGTKGLGSIFPVLEGKIVRPFLHLTRDEIEREIQSRKLEFRIDSSNRDVHFRRNRVRLELLPLLRNDFNPEIISLLGELSERARDDEEVLEQLARERALPWWVREGSEEKMAIRPLVDFPPAVQRRVLRQMIFSVRGNIRGLNHRHIESLRELASDAQSGRKVMLPGQLEARKEFDWLIVGERSIAPCLGFCYPVECPGEVPVPELGATFRFKIIEAETFGKTYNDTGIGGIDPQKLPGKLVLRSWQPGDRIQPVGGSKFRKLKELMGQGKVPARQRSSWPVLESGGQIIWARGFPPAKVAAASSESKQILIIEELGEPAR